MQVFCSSRSMQRISWAKNQQTNKQKNTTKNKPYLASGKGEGAGVLTTDISLWNRPHPFSVPVPPFWEHNYKNVWRGFFFRKLTLKLEVFAIATPPQPWNKMFFFSFFFFWSRFWIFATLSPHQHTHTYTVYRNRRY